MFWNNEFLDSSPSHIDVVLQMPTVKLSDILFEDDLLQELKTSNVTLTNFLSRPEIIAELVDNITQLTEKDCCDKLLYSRVHAAYISCEILTGGSPDIFVAILNHPESLSKVISCLTVNPRPQSSSTSQEIEKSDQLDCEEKSEQLDCEEKSNQLDCEENPKQPDGEENSKQPDGEENPKQPDGEENSKQPDGEENSKQPDGEEQESLSVPPRPETPQPQQVEEYKENHNDGPTQNSFSENDEVKPSEQATEASNPVHDVDQTESIVTKVVPQKASLVSKLISTIHSSAADTLSCYITREIRSFRKLLQLLIHNIDVSGAFEILSTLIKRTTPPETRYVFCEILNNLNTVYDLIDVMTLSGVEDKQRNACQLLCDIIVIGRQENSEQTRSNPRAQDELTDCVESGSTMSRILTQMFPKDNNHNSTAIVCGMKVIQTLLERKPGSDERLLEKTIEQTQEEIETHVIKFHELLMNPPRQEPIKTTFGIIQKPLGYMRLEAVNLIRALISTNSPNIIRKLVELRTMNVIIDLFIQYYWNNLLHTQVEQALCLIIKNCRHDEELNYHIDMLQQQDNHQSEISRLNDDEIWLAGQRVENGEISPKKQDEKPEIEQQLQSEEKASTSDIPSRALLSQILNECDLIGRLLMPSSNATNSNNLEGATIINNNNVHDKDNGGNGQNVDVTSSNQAITSNGIETSDENHSQDNSSGNVEDGPKNEATSDENHRLQVNCKLGEGEWLNTTDKENASPDISNSIEHIGNKNHVKDDNSDRASNNRRFELQRRRRRNDEQANFGHIIQMINSIAINRDLDTIRDHLNVMKDKRPDLYDRWTTFVNVDVASFKEISLYYDAQSANNNVNSGYSHSQHNHISNNSPLTNSMNSSHLNSTSNNDHVNGTADDDLLEYLSFDREVVIPTINVDVLPRLRRSKNAH